MKLLHTNQGWNREIILFRGSLRKPELFIGFLPSAQCKASNVLKTFTIEFIINHKGDQKSIIPFGKSTNMRAALKLQHKVETKMNVKFYFNKVDQN